MDPDTGKRTFYWVVKANKKTLSCCELYDDLVIDIPVKNAEYLPPVFVTKDALKHFARYEISVKKLTGGKKPLERIVAEEPIEMTAEDLQAAFNHALIRGEKAESEWIKPMAQYFIARDFIKFGSVSRDGEEEKKYRFLPTEAELVKRCFNMGLFFLEDKEEGMKISLDALEKIIRNRDLPVSEREYDGCDKFGYIKSFGNGKVLATASEKELALYRQYLDELVMADMQQAQETLAYDCYGGNQAYPCDWNKSKELLEQLLEKTGDPGYANSLGYIYYYGRCSDGVPDYGKAFYYFSIGAAGGYFESRYKIADMFREGKGVPKNLEIEEHIICELYDDTIKPMRKAQWSNKFADVAFRMGKLCEEAIPETQPDAAVFYYLQAKYAIQKRREIDDYFGDEAVEKRINEALTEILPKTSYAKAQNVKTDSLGGLLYRAKSEQDYYVMQVKKLKKSFRLNIGILQRTGDSDIPMMFITIPQQQ